ncbi:HEAT repeat domain-containing protein [Pontibacter toksunensis]|uniref:HEAT repeat domain-containing protein n=1 Tax=Pontibacter toksunensis TaxID=1332631 RepID=A0ABW6BZI2_9BACT
MKWDNIEALLQKYYRGETTLTEEKELASYFCQSREWPDHLKVHAALFQYYTHQQKVQLESDEWLLGKIEELAPAQGKQRFLPLSSINSYWQVAASILLLAVTFWAGIQFKQNNSTAQNSEVAALRQEVEEMKKVLLVSSTASERISVVSQQFSADPNEELIQVLIHTMNNDSNVNVRLAAAEALYQYNDNANVRDAFIQSLKLQTDPIIQMTLIDMLVTLKEKKAVDQLTQLTQRKYLLPIVKSKAQEGIDILI